MPFHIWDVCKKCQTSVADFNVRISFVSLLAKPLLHTQKNHFESQQTTRLLYTDHNRAFFFFSMDCFLNDKYFNGKNVMKIILFNSATNVHAYLLQFLPLNRDINAVFPSRICDLLSLIVLLMITSCGNSMKDVWSLLFR